MNSNIQFQCKQCGKCCSAYGYVYLTTKDRILLASHFGLSVTRFTKDYCEKKHGEFHLKEPHKDCCFLKDNCCEVYPVRPAQCQTWPFWAENMQNGIFKKSAATYCPGVRLTDFTGDQNNRLNSNDAQSAIA